MIIGQVEKRSWKVKVLNAVIHLLLILGATTMVYPLLLMISGSFKSNVDFSNFTLVPQYLYDDLELYKKHLFTKYNTTMSALFSNYKDPQGTLNNLQLPSRVSEQRVKDFEQFTKYCTDNKPHYWYCLGMVHEYGVKPYTLRQFTEWLKKHPVYGEEQKNGLEELGKLTGRTYANYNSVIIGSEHFFGRRNLTDYSSGLHKVFLAFKEQQKENLLTNIWKDIDGYYMTYLRRHITSNLHDFNVKLGTNFNTWADVVLDETVPDNKRFAEEWCNYIKNEVNPVFIYLDVKKAQKAWKKFLLRKYGSFDNLKKVYEKELNWKSEKDITLTEQAPLSGTMRADYLEFLKNNTTLSNSWHNSLKAQYKTIANLNKAWGTKYKMFTDVPEYDIFVKMKLTPAMEQDCKALRKNVEKAQEFEVAADAIRLVTPSTEYRKWLAAKYGNDIKKLRDAYKTGYKSFNEIPLLETAPGDYSLACTSDWQEFIKLLQPEDIGLLRQAGMEYRNVVASFYTVNGVLDQKKISEAYDYTINNVNEIFSFNAYPADTVRFKDQLRNDYIRVIKSGKMNRFFRIPQVEKHLDAWHSFLHKKYGSIEKLNKKWHMETESFKTAVLPIPEFEYTQMMKNRPFLIKEFLKRNYLMVFDTLFLNGNAALNTVIYCFLSVLVHLLVNPLCAYGLSRYKPASSYKILLFLMLPMAFPAMVLGIPQFLLIKKLGLLNTFAALILPGMASGYSIFLLKGFFDSLPKELFESASIDGASEWNIFWNIAMSLSKPILSVIALSSFTSAYANFMMAFLLCQDKSMWTMMVYLYQLQQTSSQAVGFAALIIAAIPTLLVFIFCQNIIIRGIVVPTEK
ncbi:MAG: ABC transporter permease subunit [Lentisphaeria bacterium]|nr:ABC transporter permease subunit [Lentisphaeria bacterium]